MRGRRPLTTGTWFKKKRASRGADLLVRHRRGRIAKGAATGVTGKPESRTGAGPDICRASRLDGLRGGARFVHGGLRGPGAGESGEVEGNEGIGTDELWCREARVIEHGPENSVEGVRRVHCRAGN